MKPGIDVIVGKLPPPDKLRKPADEGAAGEGDAEDYNAAEDSMKAFMDALKGDDVKRALDAWGDVQKNC
jgi:hypothetical protein